MAPPGSGMMCLADPIGQLGWDHAILR